MPQAKQTFKKLMRLPLLPFSKMDIRFDTGGLSDWLESCDLWGEYPQRCGEGSPHAEVTDIWARFKDPEECLRTGDWSSFVGEHESTWLKDIPGVKEISQSLMGFTKGEQLGGVLITKIEPGKGVLPHIDNGWHASFYDKYLVSIKGSEGARFCFDEGYIEPKNGEVYAFRNDVMHWVENNSNESRIAMIVCIKQHKFSKEGLCLGQ